MKHVVCRTGKTGVEFYQGELFGQPIFSADPDRAKSLGSGRTAASLAETIGNGAVASTVGKAEKKAKKAAATA